MKNEVFEFLDGQRYVLNGISGVFRYDHYVDRHNLEVNQLWHEPDEAGKGTEAYRNVRSMLHDDWGSDLTNSIDLYCQVAVELGYVEPRDILPDGLPKCTLAWLTSEGRLSRTLEIVYPGERPPDFMVSLLEVMGWQRGDPRRQPPPAGPYRMTKLWLSRTGSGLFGEWTEPEWQSFLTQAHLVLSTFGWVHVPCRQQETDGEGRDR